MNNNLTNEMQNGLSEIKKNARVVKKKLFAKFIKADQYWKELKRVCPRNISFYFKRVNDDYFDKVKYALFCVDSKGNKEILDFEYLNVEWKTFAAESRMLKKLLSAPI